jgi:hypothetical protein
MPFKLTKEYHKDTLVIIFTFNKEFTEKDFHEFLGILSKLLERKKEFTFIVDARSSTMAPIKCGILLVKWMRDRKDIIRKYLLGSCLVTNYTILIKAMNWVFKKQKPVSPNIMTKDYDIGHAFIIKSIENRTQIEDLDDSIEDSIEGLDKDPEYLLLTRS